MTAVQWLALAALTSAVLWVPYILHRMMVLGVVGALGNLSAEGLAKHAAWALRARAADLNSAVNLAIFGSLVFCAYAVGVVESSNVVLAAQVYFWARLVYYLAYTAGIPGVRTLAFLTGFGAQIVVAIAVLGA